MSDADYQEFLASDAPAKDDRDLPAPPPHNLEAEQALLGAVLVNNDAFHLVSNFLEPKHFFEAVHSRIWDAIAVRIAANRLASAITIKADFEEDLTLKEIGGTVYLARLAASATTIINSPEYARIIVDLWRRREAQIVLERMRAGLLVDYKSADANAVLRHSLADLIAVEGQRPDDKPVAIGTAADGLTRALSDAYQAGDIGSAYAFCGSHDLAKAISGWRRGRFYVIAGRPSQGKTTTALSLLLRTALKRHGVLFFSLEMGRDELVEMALCNLASRNGHRVEYRDIAQARVLDEEFATRLETVMQVQATMNSLPLIIDQRAGLSLAQIRSTVTRQVAALERAGQRLDVVCVDHVGLLKAGERYAGNPVKEMEELTAGLKQLAKDFDLAVIGLVQLNRASEARDDKRPGLADLRWGGGTEQDADAVLFVYREAYYLERKRFDELSKEEIRKENFRLKQNTLELNVAKQRGGPTPSIELYCDMGCAVVQDMDRHHV